MNADLSRYLPVLVALAIVALLVRAYRRRFRIPSQSAVFGANRMSQADRDAFTEPQDMSAVRRELEELAGTEEVQRYQQETELRKRRLGLAPPPPPKVVERPPADEMSEEERELLAQTDERASVRR